jgi:hypothetical protein
MVAKSRFALALSAVLVMSGTVMGACKSNKISSSTAEGRDVQGPDGIRLLIPAGALPPEVEITITEAAPGTYPAQPSDPRFAGFKSKVYSIEPHGTKFASPVTVEFPKPATAGANDAIWKASPGGSWESLWPPKPGSVLSAEISSLSFFATGDVPCEEASKAKVNAPTCPPQDDEACKGKKEGDTCESKLSPGGCEQATCTKFPDGLLACVPGVPRADCENADAGSGPGTGACTGSGNKLDSAITPGTASLGPGMWSPLGGSPVSLASLAHACVTNRGTGDQLTLVFAASPDFCRGISTAGGLINKSIPHLEVNLFGYQGGNQTFPDGEAGIMPFTAAQNPTAPTCNWEFSGLVQAAGIADGGQPVAASVTFQVGPQRISGTLSLTTNGGAQTISGTFQNLPFVTVRTTVPPYCCE